MQFLYQARGSLEELRYFIFLSKDIKYISDATYAELEAEAVNVSKMLNGLINSIKQRT